MKKTQINTAGLNPKAYIQMSEKCCVYGNIHSQGNLGSFLFFADGVAMVEGLAEQIFKVWKESDLPSFLVCSIPSGC